MHVSCILLSLSVPKEKSRVGLSIWACYCKYVHVYLCLNSRQWLPNFSAVVVEANCFPLKTGNSESERWANLELSIVISVDLYGKNLTVYIYNTL